MEWIKPEWVKDLKVGDKVYSIERHPRLPNGSWKWESVIIKIESNYIETEYKRVEYDWLIEMTKNLAPHHRTFSKQTVKNYFGPDGSINIEHFGVG